VGAFVNGSTGEGLSLTLEERRAVAERWVNAAPAGFQIIVHVAHPSARNAWELASHAARIGADAIAEIGPMVFRPRNVEALAEYSRQTASRAPELPYYYYHIPSISGVCFPMIDYLKAAESRIPNLAGLKYTYEDLMDIQLCREFKQRKYDILYGRDETSSAVWSWVSGARSAALITSWLPCIPA
jgi:N-acetylneuraminate lyase